MTKSVGSRTGFFGGLLLTVFSVLLVVLVGWRVLIILGKYPIALLVLSSLVLVAIISLVGFAVRRSDEERSVAHEEPEEQTQLVQQIMRQELAEALAPLNQEVANLSQEVANLSRDVTYMDALRQAEIEQSLKEIEEVLIQHRGVQEVAARIVPDDDLGERVKAFVERRPGSTVTEEDLVSYCKKHLAAYKVPKQLEFLSEMPKSHTGKIMLHEPAEEERE